MKSKKLLLIISVATLVLVVLIVALVYNENFKSIKTRLPAKEMMSEKLEEHRVLWYNKLLSVMGDNDDLIEKNIVEEYMIVDHICFYGIEHINIKIYSDRTGEMIHKFYNSDVVGDGEIVVDETFDLTAGQVEQVEKVFSDNNFWKIPSKHPEEVLVLDGNRVYIEGIKGNKYNIISMQCPDADKFEIAKIYDEIMKFAEVWKPINKQ